MVITGGYTVTPHHRQNRRRERPGSRTRRTITRKASVQYDCAEGLLDARDSSVPLPSDKARPSPLLRQNFDQSWQRWKARQAEEKAIAVMDNMQLEQEQQRLFGGDFGDDDELYRLGILYNDEDNIQDSESNITLCDVPLEQSVPIFILRHKQPKRSRRRPMRSSPLPLYLSFSSLSDDSDIARLLSPSVSHTPTIQHREITLPTSTASGIEDTLQSLLPTLALESSIHFLDNTPIISTPHLITEDWTFINTGYHTPTATPSSEPEAWVLIDGS